MKKNDHRLITFYQVSVWMLTLSILICGCGTPAGFYDDVNNLQVMRSNYHGEQQKPEYILHSGDELEITLYYNPELNTKAVVRPDGIISLQLIGDVKAGGLSPARVQQIIREKYAKILRDPEVTVTVKSFSQQAYIGGEVVNPQMIKLGSGKTTLQAILEAGGFKDTAEMRSVLILRGIGQPRFQAIKIDLKKLFMSTKLVKNDLQLQPNDVVYVPKSLIGKVDQFVDQYMNKIVPSEVFTNLIRGK